MVEEEPAGIPWLNQPQTEAPWLIRLFASSRYFVFVAVVGSFLSAVTLYAYGALVVINIIVQTIREFRVSIEGAKHLQVSFIELTDVFLLGTVLFIVAFGLYQLFIQPDLPVPAWLRINALEQLTGRLVEVVGVLLGVTFLAFAVEEAHDFGLLEFGVSVAVVIAALSLLLVVSHRVQVRPHPPPND
jgi:uncharacterized membrane protein YqhA